MSDVEFFTSGVIPNNDDIDGLKFILKFIADEKQNDFWNPAVENYFENYKQNQENVDPKSRYVKKLLLLMTNIEFRL